MRTDATPPQVWTKEFINAVAGGIQDGKSFAVIAAELGRTRASVSSIAKRLKVKAQYGGAKDKPQPPRAEVGVPQKLYAEDAGMTLVELRRDQCRFSIGAREDAVRWVFCGEATEVGKPFCKTHRRICYVPIVRKPK